jgi:hypothetical protein
VLGVTCGGDLNTSPQWPDLVDRAWTRASWARRLYLHKRLRQMSALSSGSPVYGTCTLIVW